MTYSPDHPQRPTADPDDENAIDLLFLTDSLQEDAAVDEQAGFPVIEWYLGQPVPDLNEIAEDRWRAVLTPLTRSVREAAARRLRSLEQSRQATALVLLELEDCDRKDRDHRRAQRPHSLPTSTQADRLERASRQINFRISPRQHQRLAEAAPRDGAKPGQLARILTMRGVEHMLWEERSRG